MLIKKIKKENFSIDYIDTIHNKSTQTKITVK